EARAEIGELLFLLAAVMRLDADGELPDRQRAVIGWAMEFNRRAEKAWPAGQTPGAIWQQRASFAADIGDEDLARRARGAAASPHSPRDACMAACVLVSQRRFRAALPLWQQAVRDD